MNDKINGDNQEQRAIDAAQERSGEPHPRDILKREYNEAMKRGDSYEAYVHSYNQFMEHLANCFDPFRAGPPEKRGAETDRAKRDDTDMDR